MYMAGIRSLMSPIHKLPHEILVEVFKYICCDDIGTNSILPGDKKRLPTLTLSRVCIQWYSLVTSTPALWSSFGTQDLDSSRTPSLFKLFLERSHLHPIDFEFSDFESSLNFADESPDPPSDSLSAVTASANRWRHVNISTSELCVRAIFQSLIARKRHLSALMSLSINSEILELMLFPVICPNLQCLTLRGVALEFQVPLPAVTHLDLHGLTPQETSRLIACCSNVQDITLNSLTSMLESAPPMTSCNAQRLAIKLGGSEMNNTGFLGSMDLPRLGHLELSDSPDNDAQNVENLCSATCSMVERSQSSRLSHLFIHFMRFNFGQLLRLLLCVPTVTILDLEESLGASNTTGVYLVLKALIAPHQETQLEEPDQDRDDERILEFEGVEEDVSELESNDEEDGDTLDFGNMEVPDGLCLLPRLKELNLIVFRLRSDLLLQLMRSRWKHSSLLVSREDNSGSTACVRLQMLRIKYSGVPGQRALGRRALGRSRMLEKSLYKFEKAGMAVDVSYQVWPQ